MTSAAEAPEPISEEYARLIAAEARVTAYELYPNPATYPRGRLRHHMLVTLCLAEMHPSFAAWLSDLQQRYKSTRPAYDAFMEKVKAGANPAGGTEE